MNGPEIRIPEIIAHRGASRECLENTLAAFSRALAMGADAIELDVHATRDGVLVVHHDARIVPRDGPVRAIADCDAHTLSGLALADGSPIPTLDGVCDLVGRAARLYVEVKASHVADLVVDALQRFPGVDMAVHSFDHRLPIAVRARRPATPIGLLSASYPLDLAGWLGSVRPDALWQHEALIDEALVATAHAMGARLIAWTENDPPHARQLAAWGVDGLCSDIPDVIRAALAAR